MDHLSTIPDAPEDWSESEGLPETKARCINGHTFVSHTKFSGTQVAFVSRKPCPVCGTYQLDPESCKRGLNDS